MKIYFKKTKKVKTVLQEFDTQITEAIRQNKDLVDIWAEKLGIGHPLTVENAKEILSPRSFDEKSRDSLPQ